MTTEDPPRRYRSEDWTCPDCGQSNSGWADECGRCGLRWPADEIGKPPKGPKPAKRFAASVSTNLDLSEAVPGASGAVKDTTDNASLDSILSVVRSHLEAADENGTVNIEVKRLA